MSCGHVSVLFLMDLSAAFDTINHNILLQRLQHVIGIKGIALGWFKSYLSYRFQFVFINEESSLHTRVWSSTGFCAWTNSSHFIHASIS